MIIRIKVTFTIYSFTLEPDSLSLSGSPWPKSVITITDPYPWPFSLTLFPDSTLTNIEEFTSTDFVPNICRQNRGSFWISALIFICWSFTFINLIVDFVIYIIIRFGGHISQVMRRLWQEKLTLRNFYGMFFNYLPYLSINLSSDVINFKYELWRFTIERDFPSQTVNFGTFCSDIEFLPELNSRTEYTCSG